MIGITYFPKSIVMPGGGFTIEYFTLPEDEMKINNTIKLIDKWNKDIELWNKSKIVKINDKYRFVIEKMNNNYN